MQHSFDIDHARAYGVHEAVLIYHLRFWIVRNRANGENFREGRTWTYNSVKAFADLFPYMSPKQVRRALEHLVEAAVLLTGNYNATGRDRTLWYAFNDEDRFLDGAPRHLPGRADADDPEGESHLTGGANGVARKGKSLIRADGKPDGNPDSGRGTRLPEDWSLKQEYLDATVAMTAKLADELPDWKGGAWTVQHTLFEAEKFRDYWVAKSGKDATKRDWPGTWRNWVRNAGPMRAGAKKGGGGNWWASDELALAKANEVGVGPARTHESRDAWHARIKAAIDNGGTPPAPRALPVTPLDPVPSSGADRTAPSEAGRALLAGTLGALKSKFPGGGIAP
ncbi:hypothetical protein POK33_38145 [Burkholderia cenocepacia]|uniref:hypothetical protein n=1 Tax=Burkholderia cenocepacia TaxID=95486 RepID=UPI0023B9C97B|nr:hypothetical protein [Burkholderia cenocepacia]MDF0506577.1 hypothetical protein [Burkholderia cenocepacia]